MTEKFDIIVLAGQSNAVGYGVGDVEEEYIPSENIMWLEDEADAHFEKNEVTGKDELVIHYPSTFCISVAEEPLSANGQKLGKPAILFAKNYYDTYLKGTDRKVLIINAAVGGTGFARNEWGVENAILYTRLCDMVNYALGQNKDNKLAAFLWHQGECDAFENAEWDAEKRYTVHKRNLLLMFGDFKKKFNCPHIPMVTGEFCNEWYEENKIPCDAVLRAVCEVFSAENNGACVKTADLLSNNQATGNGDNIHFCRPAAYELGRRYFEAYRQLKKIMNYEHSAGAVVYTMVEGVPHFALVVEKNGDCGLPKGHIEGNETEKETALREIWEEIGVRVEIVSAFKKTVQYPLRNGRMKKVTYFLAEYQDQAIRVDTGEVGDAYLLPFAQALSALKYPKSKEVLASAYEYMGHMPN